MLRARLVLALALLGACGPKTIWTGRTADRLHRVDVMRDGGFDFVMVDGKRRAAYRGVAGWSIALARDHIAFAARIGNDWLVIHDGRISRDKWDGIGTLRLTDDNRLVYVAHRADGWHVVAGDAVGPRVDAVLAGTLQIAGPHVAYVAEVARAAPGGTATPVAIVDGKASALTAAGGTTTPARVQAIVDGKTGSVFDGIGQLSLASDGRYAYAARVGLDAFVVADGKLGARCDAVSMLTLGPHGRVAYVATLDEAQHIVIDGEIGATLDSISHVVFRDDGKHVAWIGRIEGSDVLALDDAPVGTWAHRREPKLAFRPTAAGQPGVGLAYVLTTERGEQVVVDGTLGRIYDEVRTPVWSSTGRLAYAARRGTRWSIVDGDREHSPCDAVGDPALAGDRTAFVCRQGAKNFVVVDGRYFSFDLVFEDTVAFSADGTRWGAVAGDRTHEQLFIVIDGTQRVPVAVRELYSAVASGGDEATLRTWTQAELDR